jgi:hypothetical protein
VHVFLFRFSVMFSLFSCFVLLALVGVGWWGFLQQVNNGTANGCDKAAGSKQQVARESLAQIEQEGRTTVRGPTLRGAASRRRRTTVRGPTLRGAASRRRRTTVRGPTLVSGTSGWMNFFAVRR